METLTHQNEMIGLVSIGIIILLLFLSYRDRKACRRKYKEASKKLKAKEQKSKEIIEKFFRTVSHDIRTPLNGIIGITELLKQTELTEKQQEYVNLISVSSNQLTAVITDLMEFYAFEKPSVIARDSVFSIHEVVGDVSDLLLEKVNQKHLIFNTNIDTRIPFYLKGDLMRLRLLLLNLLKTSLYHTSKGEIMVQVDLVRRFDRKVELKIHIADTGKPFSEEELQSYIRIDSEETSYEETSFLDYLDPSNRLKIGMARRIVELLGGTLAIESRPGFNNSYWFSLIFEDVTDTQKKYSSQLTPLSSLKVLLIDGNGGSRAIYRQYLQYFKVRFEEADTIEKALSLLEIASNQGDPYQVVIISEDEAKEESTQFARLLKTNPIYNQPNIIQLCGTPDVLTSQDAPTRPFQTIISKPVKLNDLYQALAVLVKGADSSQTAKMGSGEPFKLRILLAEDNLINEKVAVATLERLGHSVETASNGAIAVQKFIEKSSILLSWTYLCPK